MVAVINWVNNKISALKKISFFIKKIIITLKIDWCKKNKRFIIIIEKEEKKFLPSSESIKQIVKYQLCVLLSKIFLYIIFVYILLAQ